MNDDIEVADSPASFPTSVGVGHLSKLSSCGVDTFVLLELVYEDGAFPVCFLAEDALTISSALMEAACMLGAVEE